MGIRFIKTVLLQRNWYESVRDHSRTGVTLKKKLTLQSVRLT